jgi:RNA polymerase sigma-70 factor (ECF subfamily)
MESNADNIDGVLDRARGGDQQALAELFALYRERLRRMVHLRLDHRLQGRVDPSDVVQDAYLILARRFP